MEMKNYIFYKNEGLTKDNDGNDVENCQILGWVEGKNPQDAFQSLKKENQFILKLSFDSVLCQELADEEVYRFSLKT